MDWIDELAELFLSIVPTSWLPYVLMALLAVAAVVKLINWSDMRDGRRDVPVIGVLVPWVSIVLELGQTLIELGGVKLPGKHTLLKFGDLWLRARMLLASPHVDDAPMDGKKS